MPNYKSSPHKAQTVMKKNLLIKNMHHHFQVSYQKFKVVVYA